MSDRQKRIYENMDAVSSALPADVQGIFVQLIEELSVMTRGDWAEREAAHRTVRSWLRTSGQDHPSPFAGASGASGPLVCPHRGCRVTGTMQEIDDHLLAARHWLEEIPNLPPTYRL